MVVSMDALTDIEARINARMTELNQRLGSDGPQRSVSVTGRDFDATEAIRSVSGIASARGGGRRIGICVGLPKVNPAAYGGSEQPCPGCDLDATDFAKVLEAAGFETTLLLEQKATKQDVLSAMQSAANALKEEDLLVMSVAGHGFRGNIDGKMHETWCLWDGMLLDDDIVSAVKKFVSGVRIVMINDQCHSGGIFTESTRRLGGWLRGMFGRDVESPMLIQFAACRAEESSIGYPIGGTWMTALMKILAVKRDISWRAWFDEASSHPSLTKHQQPQWVEMGPVSNEFRNANVLT